MAASVPESVLAAVAVAVAVLVEVQELLFPLKPQQIVRSQITS